MTARVSIIHDPRNKRLEGTTGAARLTSRLKHLSIHRARRAKKWHLARMAKSLS